MKMVVDNVAVQAIEACLMTRLPDIISPTSVMEMEDDKVSRIAAEPAMNHALREKLDRKFSGMRYRFPLTSLHALRPSVTE